MAGLTAEQAAALAPLERDLLARAESDAASVREAADARARTMVVSAREQADAILAAARAQGEADAAVRFAAARTEARRAARAIVLSAERAAYEDLLGRATSAVKALLADQVHQAELERLLRDHLGPAAAVRPDRRGGLTAEGSGGRRIDASSDALVGAAAASLDVEQLWE